MAIKKKVVKLKTKATSKSAGQSPKSKKKASDKSANSKKKAKKKSKSKKSSSSSKFSLGPEGHYDWGVTERDLTRDLNEHLSDAWDSLREFAMSLGPQRVYASAQAIMFAKKICYFFVRPKRSHLEVTILLPRKIEGLRSLQVAATKEKYSNVFKVEHADHIGVPLTDWLREAYEFAPDK